MTEDEAAIRQVVETWMTASRKGDLETVLGLMTEDVVFMVPGKEPFGKEAFAAASRGMGETKIDGVSDIVCGEDFGGIFAAAAGKFGEDAAWADGADADAHGSQVFRHAATETLQGPLGGAIDAASREGVLAG